MVPDKLAFYLHQLHVRVVDLSGNLGRPMLGDAGEFFRQVNFFWAHVRLDGPDVLTGYSLLGYPLPPLFRQIFEIETVSKMIMHLTHNGHCAMIPAWTNRQH